MTDSEKIQLMVQKESILRVIAEVEQELIDRMLAGEEFHRVALSYKNTKRTYIEDSKKIHNILAEFLHDDEIFSITCGSYYKLLPFSIIKNFLAKHGVSKNSIDVIQDTITFKKQPTDFKLIVVDKI